MSETNRIQVNACVDGLRDRIATIIHDKDTVKCCDECTISAPGPWDYEVADAVIAELGLRQQWDFDGMITYNDFPTSPPGGRQRTRWVTAWGEWQQIQ